MFFDEIQSRANELAEEIVSEMIQVLPEAFGLDNRCGQMFANFETGVIAVPESSLRSIRYYGGFEYIDDECALKVGEYTFYVSENDRVEGCFEFYEINKEEE